MSHWGVMEQERVWCLRNEGKYGGGVEEDEVRGEIEAVGERKTRDGVDVQTSLEMNVPHGAIQRRQGNAREIENYEPSKGAHGLKPRS